MRSRRCWAILIAVIFFSLFGWMQVTHAKSYQIKNYAVQVNITKAGNAQVTQKIAYQFDGDFNGVFYRQDLKGVQGLQHPEVAVVDKNGQQRQLTASANEASGTYTFSQDADQARFKVFYPIRNAAATFIYRYQLSGAVTNYLDTAELNWKVIGTGWDVPLKNVRITIQLPQQPVNQLQAWTHGPLAGTTKVTRQAGKVTIALAKNPANTFVETHLLFPTAVTAANQNVQRQKRKQAVQKQEAKLAEQANAKRRRARLIPSVIAVASLILGGVILIWHLDWLQHHLAERYPAPAPIKHWYELPDYPPAVAQRLLKKTGPDKKAFTATLLDLAVAKKLAITSVKIGRQTTFNLKPSADFKPKQKLFKLLFEKIPQKKEQGLNLLEIKTYAQRDTSGQLSDAYQDWVLRTRGATDALRYENVTNNQIRGHAWAVTIVSTLLAIGASVALYFGFPAIRLPLWSLAGIMLVASWVLLVLKVWQLPRYTKLGAQKINELRGFKQMLEDVGHFDMAQVGDLILWDRILPYAVAFGSADKVVAALKVNFSQAQLAESLPINYPLFIYGHGGLNTLNFGEAFTSSFGSSLATSHSFNSSVSGSGGGFSGGSSGGFGGGSGGGAF